MTYLFADVAFIGNAGSIDVPEGCWEGAALSTSPAGVKSAVSLVLAKLLERTCRFDEAGFASDLQAYQIKRQKCLWRRFVDLIPLRSDRNSVQ